LFSALSAVLSQISIPIGVVPINLTHVSIFLAAGLLGANLGVCSQIIFVLMGAVGIPVFSGFSSGLGIIFGPAGGFIFGYIGCVYVTGLIIDRFGRSITILALAMYAGWFVTYLLGILWFVYYTKTSFFAALPVCLFPFIPGDFLKTVLSVTLINRLRPVLRN